jgi:hypothetical protein
MPDVLAGPVVTAACFPCCRRAMGAACTRHSLRPLFSFEGHEQTHHPDISCRGKVEACLKSPLREAKAPGAYCIDETLMKVGPRITTNNTGRKNRIIGTVSFGGSAAAFFSASVMRMSRFSCAITRRLCPSGVP